MFRHTGSGHRKYFKAGNHRFTSDLHYQPLPLAPSFSIAAIFQNTAPEPTAPFVMPGKYTVKLIAGGKTFLQPLVVKMDPRVKTSAGDLEKQFKLSLQLYQLRQQLITVMADKSDFEKTIKNVNGNTDNTSSLINQLAQFDKPGHQGEKSLSQLDNALGNLLNQLQDADNAPTSQVIKASNDLLAEAKKKLAAWDKLKLTIGKAQK